MTKNPRIECDTCGAVFPDKPFLDLRRMVETLGGPRCKCGGRMGIVERQAPQRFRITQLGPGERDS